MKNLIYTLLMALSLGLGFKAYAESLTGKTLTLTDKTGYPLVIKIGPNSVTLAPNESKIFTFTDLQGAKVSFEKSKWIPRSLELATIALGLQRKTDKNANADLIPGSIGLGQAKIANVTYGPPTKGAKRAR